MPTQQIDIIQDPLTTEQLSEELAKLQKLLRYLLNGNLDSENTREIGGWRISQTELLSKDKDVGISTADVGINPVRFWAGSADMDTAPWRVHQNGVMYSTGGVFQSASGYPKVAMNLENNLIAAYSSHNTYIAFTPLGFGSVPALSLFSNGSLVGFLNRSVGGTTMGTFDGENLNFQPSGNLQISGMNGTSGTFFASSVFGGPANMQIVFTKGIRVG